MKNIALTIISAALLSACQTVQAPEATHLVADANDGSFGDEMPSATTRAILIPQWHLSPQANTKDSPRANPQDENQFAIFSQLSQWIDNKGIQTVVVEGCEGEVKEGFPTRFNGWTLQELEELPNEALLRIDTQIGLKLKAKYKNQINVICGDDAKLIKQNLLTLSDLRGLLGFKIRMEEAKNEPKKQAGYAASASEVLKMPKTTPTAEVSKKLDAEIQAKLDEFENVIHQRNEVFASGVQSNNLHKPVAVVIGAIHIDDLKGQTPGAVVYTPKGLKGDEADLLREARAFLNQQQRRDK